MIEKPILAIETSDKICSCAVFYDNQKYTETSIQLKNSHSEKIFQCIDASLKLLSLDVNDCKLIAVSSGPGSFTGLRIGLSAAKGIATASNIPIVPVPTFEALALELLSSTKISEEFVIANKVNVEEIYFAKFKNEGNIYKFTDELKLIKSIELESEAFDLRIFGNVKNDKLKIIEKFAPSAVKVAEWAFLFGENLMTTDFDYLEPMYLKSFVIKRKEA